MAQQLRPLCPADVIQALGQFCAGIIRLRPKRLKNALKVFFLHSPVNDAAHKRRNQVMLALLSKSFPCRRVNEARRNIGLFYVRFQDVPDAPIRLFSAVEGCRDAFLLLAEVAQGGRLELAPLLFLGCLHETDQGLPPGLFLPAGVAVTHDGNGPRPRPGIPFPAAGRLGQEIGADLRRVLGVVQEDVGQGSLIHIPARLAGFLPKQLPGLVFGEQTGVPAIERHALVELLGVRHDVVKVPDKPLSIERQDLRVDCFLPALQPGHQHVLSVDVLGSVSRCTVAVFSDAHDFSGHPKVFQHGIPQELAPLHHVHIAHILGQLGNSHFTVKYGNFMAVERALIFCIPLLIESLPLIRLNTRGRNQQCWRSVIVEELLLKLRRILVRLDFIGQSFSRTQPTLIGVKRVQVFHAKDVVHRDLPDLPIGGLNLVERVPQVWGLLHPVGRHGPQFHRPTHGIKLKQEIALTFQLQVNLQQTPHSARGHFKEGVRSVHHVDERMLLDLHLVATDFIYPVQLSLAGRKVGGDTVNHGQAGVFTERVKPLSGIAFRRRRIAWDHHARVGASILLFHVALSPAKQSHLHSSFHPSSQV